MPLEGLEIEVGGAGFVGDDVEPGWYSATLEDIQPGPEADGRRTLRWIFRLQDGRRVSALTSRKWTVSAQNKSKSVEFAEAILQRTVDEEDDPIAVLGLLIGMQCRVQVIKKSTRSGKTVSTVKTVVPA